MSFDGLDKWRPHIDENGVLRPTNEEQRAMVDQEIGRFVRLNWFAIAMLIFNVVLLVIGLVYRAAAHIH